MIEFGFKGSNDPANKFRFSCPTVKTETQLMMCYDRRNGFMRGEVIDRADCRAALSGGKCPARRMLDEEYHTGKRLYFDPEGKALKTLPRPLVEMVERIVLVASQAQGQPLSEDEAARLGVRLREVASEPVSSRVQEPKPSAPVGSYRTQAEMCRSLVKEGLDDEAIFEKVKAEFPTFKRSSVTYYREQVGDVAPTPKPSAPKASDDGATTKAAMCRAVIQRGVKDDNEVLKEVQTKFPNCRLHTVAYYRLQLGL